MSECVGRFGKWFGHRFQVEVINHKNETVGLICTRCGRQVAAP